MFPKKSVAVLIFGTILIIAGVITQIVVPYIIRNEVNKRVVLDNGTVAYKNWKNPPADIFMNFYFFDVNNAEEVVKFGNKPNLLERGPYVYRVLSEKRNITWNANDTVSFDNPQTYIFMPEMSAGGEEDTFTALNVPMVTIADMVKSKPSWEKEATEVALKLFGETLYISLKVSDLLWGYTDKLMKFSKYMEDILHINIPGLSSKFGFMVNQSSTGLWTVDTGIKDRMKFNKVDLYNGLERLSFWKSKYCNMINGTDGSLFHPFIQKNENLYSYSNRVCRSLSYTYQMETTFRDISTYRFYLSKAVFENPTDNAMNQGFCTDSPCLKSGLLDVSVCIGAPVVISQPHFYQADKSLVTAFFGLDPNEEKHSSYSDVEPYTGVPMISKTGFQINMMISNITYISDTEKFPGLVIHPVMWLDVNTRIWIKTADNFYNTFEIFILISKISIYSLFSLGGFLVCCSSISILRQYYLRNKNKKKIKRDINTETDPLIIQDTDRPTSEE